MAIHVLVFPVCPIINVHIHVHTGVVLFLESVYLAEEVVTVAGVVGAVSVSSIIGASRSYPYYCRY